MSSRRKISSGFASEEIPSIKATRMVFSLAFDRLGGVQRLVQWANETGNLKHFYAIFAKTLPKETKTEDVNRTHEQFIELMQMRAQQNKLAQGIPDHLIEAPKAEKVLNNT